MPHMTTPSTCPKGSLRPHGSIQRTDRQLSEEGNIFRGIYHPPYPRSAAPPVATAPDLSMFACASAAVGVRAQVRFFPRVASDILDDGASLTI